MLFEGEVPRTRETKKRFYLILCKLELSFRSPHRLVWNQSRLFHAYGDRMIFSYLMTSRTEIADITYLLAIPNRSVSALMNILDLVSPVLKPIRQ